LEVRYNSEWLASLDMAEILKLTSHVTVAQMLERGDFAKRLAAETPISLMEFLYPLLQGYDSVAVKADVELGGSDQLWNLMMGRIIQERYGMSPQVALTMPLLVGTDGVQKMSQSLDNYIGVSEPAEEMFGKVMSIDDDTMGEWFRLAADLDQAELDSIQLGLREESLHPREAKARLAKEIVTLYWGAEAAQAAEAAFNRVFRDRMAPGEIPSWQLPTEDPINLPGLLRAAGVVSSAGEGRRLITQGAVSLDGNVLKDENVRRETLVDGVLRIGKRRFLRLVV
jgi:tyrosyl-tRNA synthetase